MNKYLDKNSKIKSSLNLKNNNVLSPDDVEKIKSLIVDTQTINEYYFEKDSIRDKTYKLKQNAQDLSYSFNTEDVFDEEAFKVYYRNSDLDLVIEVSNLGRVRINDKIAAQADKNCQKVGYLQLEYCQKIKKAWDVIPENYIYQMVAKVWLGVPDGENWVVHHITNNGYDNRVENLIWADKSLHDEIHK